MQLFTDYYIRLMRYIEFLKKVVPLHDDLFDFFYEALPGYEHVGERRILLGCWGSLNDPAVCDFKYQNMTNWGRAMFVTPGVVVDGKLVTNDLVDINLGMRILLGHSFYDDWEGSGNEVFVDRDPLGNPVDIRHPWNQHTLPQPAEARLRQASTAGRCRRAGSTAPTTSRWTPAAARSPGCGRRRCPAWSTSADYVKATGHSVQVRAAAHARSSRRPATSGRSRSGATRWSATGPAPTSSSTPPCAALHFVEMGLAEVRAGRTETWTPFTVPDEAIAVGFTEAVRGVLSHHMVIRDGKIANYHPYPPTPWNGSVRDCYGTPGPYEDAVQNTPIFEENPPERFKGIDIMRAVRSFDPCLPCGVHMYTGNGGKVEQVHSPAVAVKPY